MRKTNQNISLAKTIKALILCLFVVSLFFPFYLFRFRPKDYESYPTVQIIVEDKKVIKGGYRNSYTLFVLSGSDSYRVGGSSRFARELYDELQIGESVQITYEQRYDLFWGMCNDVLDFKNEEQTYVDFDEIFYWQNFFFITGIVILSIVEFVFLFLLIYSIVVLYKNIRADEKKKAKKKLNKPQ